MQRTCFTCSDYSLCCFLVCFLTVSAHAEDMFGTSNFQTEDTNSAEADEKDMFGTSNFQTEDTNFGPVHE